MRGEGGEAHLVQQADLDDGLVVQVDEHGPVVGERGDGDLPHAKVAHHSVQRLLQRR